MIYQPKPMLLNQKRGMIRKRWLLNFIVTCMFMCYTCWFIVLVRKTWDLQNGSIRVLYTTLLERSAKYRIPNHTTLRSDVTRSPDNKHDVATGSEFQAFHLGPGKNGSAINLSEFKVNMPKYAESDKKHRFNTFISDVIGLRRKLSDMRPAECRTMTYPDNLPPISVVIIFRDEWPSIVLRTVYSVLDMTPDTLLKEIIIVDDGSTDAELKLKVAIHARSLEKVTLITIDKPGGLMLARQTGIEAVTAEYFVVMDSHMEVAEGWSEPLIHRLVQVPKALLCSHVGSIDKENFKFILSSNKPEKKEFENVFPFFHQVTMDQMFVPYSHEFRSRRNGSVEPIPFAVQQGMMMAMRTDYFLQLGGFDPGMRIWGSEQIELSVKVWLCGGRVEMVPCSAVAHMFRVTPWGGLKLEDDYLLANKARMARVWIDPPFLDLFEDYVRDKKFTTGDITKRRAIRERNKCQPYQYFVDVVKAFSEVYFPVDVKRFGHIYNKAVDKCLDVAKENNVLSLILYQCHPQVASNQYFTHTSNGQIRSVDSTAVSVVKRGNVTIVDVTLRPANWGEKETLWDYRPEGTIVSHLNQQCLTATRTNKATIAPCSGADTQVWAWGRT